jgi:hypothetical protein
MGWESFLHDVLVVGNSDDCGKRPNGKGWMLGDLNKAFTAFYPYLLWSLV